MKAPTPRQIIVEPLADGRMQKRIYNAQTGQYEPFGAPYTSGSKSTGKADPIAEILNGIPTDGANVAPGAVPVAPDYNAGAGPAVPGLPGAAPLANYAPSNQPLPLARQGQSAVTQRAPRMSASGANAPATPQTKAEYDALPVGAVYIDPKTGGVFTKKAKKA